MVAIEEAREGEAVLEVAVVVRIDEHHATRALIDVFETETQFSEPKETFPRRCASNLSTECERLRESCGSESRRIKELERENRYISRLMSNT